MSITVDVAGAVARVIVHRPEARNAMTLAMYDEFLHACDGLDAHPDIRVVIVRGGGGTFIAGTDIGEFRHIHTREEILTYERKMDTVIGRVERMTKVTIAMIEGSATGGGCALALACDLRYAARTARLGVPIARTLGNCLSMNNYGRLVDTVGPARAREVLFTAKLISADEAQALGMVNAAVPEERLESHVTDVATTICQHAPLTIQVTKEAIRRIIERRRGIDGDDLILRCYLSEDFREGVTAFLEKRPPVWRGR